MTSLRLVCGVVAAAVMFGLSPAVWAASGDWTGSVSGVWTNGANWSASPYPGSAAGETAAFSASGNGNTALDLEGLVSIRNLVFDTAAVSAYTLGVGSQTLVMENGGSVYAFSAVAADQTLNAALQLGVDRSASTYVITNASLATVTFAGGIAGASSGGTAGTKNLIVAGNVLVSGVLANGGASSVPLTVRRGGSVTLSAANTFSGSITVSDGFLVLKNSGALGSGAKSVTIANNANGARPAIWLDGSEGDLDIPSSVSWITSNAKEGALVNVAGHNIVRGNFSLTSGDGDTYLIANGGKLTIAGNMSAITTSRALRLRGDADGEISGIIANGSTPYMPLFHDSGSGTWTLSGANTFSGLTTIGAGTLEVAGTDGVINASTGIVVSAGATLRIRNGAAGNNVNRLKDNAPLKVSAGTIDFASDASAASFAETCGTLVLVAGHSSVSASQAAVGETSALTFEGLTRAEGASVDFSGVGLGASDRNRIFIAGQADGPIGPWATVNGGFPALYSSSLGVYGDAGATEIAATGDTVPHLAGTVSITTQGSGGDDELSDTLTSVGALVQSSPYASTVNTAGKTLQAETLMIASGQADLTIGASPNSGTLTPKTAGGSIGLVNNGAGALTVNAVLGDNGSASSFEKYGAGTVVLAGTNTFSGTASVIDGAVQLKNGLALQQAVLATGGVTFDSTVPGGSFTVGNLTNAFSLTLEDNDSNAVTLTAGSNQGNSLYGGGLNGAGTFVKAGSGALTVNGANTHGGGTQISEGTFQASHSGALGLGGVVNDGTLNLTLGNTTYSGLSTSLGGTGTVNVTLGSGSNNNPLNGDYSAFAGVWNLGVTYTGGKSQMNGADNAAATVNVLSNATVYVNAAVTKGATANLYGGTTGEAYGQMRLESGAEWAGAVRLCGSSMDATKGLLGCNSGTGTVSGTISDVGGKHPLNKVGNGILIFANSANTYAGQTWVRQGAMGVTTLKNAGEASSLGQPDVADGAIKLGNGGTAARLAYLGSGDTTDRAIDMAGTTGTAYLDQAGTGLLKFTGDLTYSGIGNKTLVLQGSSSGEGELAGVFANGAGATNKLIKSGTGKWTLSNANTFSGETEIQNGTLSLAHPGANANSSQFRFNSTVNGVLSLDHDGVGEPMKNLTIGVGYSGTIASGAGAGGVGVTHQFNDWSLSRSTVTVVRSASVLSGSPALYVRTLNLSGGGAYITGINPVDADMTIGSAAILANSNVKTLALLGSTHGNAVTGTVYNGLNTLSLSKAGSGTWTLSGSNTYSGSTSVDEGALVLAGTKGSINSNGVLAVGAGAVLRLMNTVAENNGARLSDAGALSIRGGTFEFAHTGGGADYSETLGPVTVAGAGSVVSTSEADSGRTSALTLTSLARSSGATVDFIGTGLGLDDRNRVFISGQPEGLVGPWATVNGASPVLYTSAQGVHLTSFVATNLAARGPDSTIPDDPTADAVITTDGTQDPITLAGESTTSIARLRQTTATPAVVAMAGKTLRTYGLAIDEGGASLTLGTVPGEGVLTALATGGKIDIANASTNPLVVNAAVADNGSPVSLATSGAGVVLLGGNYGYSGMTAVTDGTLVFSNASAQVLAGPISGDGAIVKTGTNVLQLLGSNTYTGPTFVNEGILRVDQDKALGTPDAGTFVNGSTGGTLDLGCTPDVGGTRVNLALRLGSERITIQGAGYLGQGALVNSATGMQYNAVSLLDLSGDATVGGQGRWDVRNTPATFNMNDFTLTKTGPNMVGLTAATVNPGDGNIVVQEGILRLEASTKLNGSSTNMLTVLGGGEFELYKVTNVQGWHLNLEDGAIFDAANSSDNSGQNRWTGPLSVSGAVTLTGGSGFYANMLGAIAGSGTIEKTGGATITFSNTNNTYTGATLISGGTLVVSNLANVGEASALGQPANEADGTIKLGSTSNGGALTYYGEGVTTDRILDLAGTTGGATVNHAPQGLLKFTRDVATSGSGNKTFSLGGSFGGSGEMAGSITNSAGGKTAVTKNGSGTWTLSGNTGFTGDVNVAAGTLILKGEHNQGLGAINIGSSAGNGVLRLEPGMLLTGGGGKGNGSIRVGNNGGARSALYMTGGTVNRSPLTGDDGLTLGRVAGSYGSFNMTGGELNITRIQTGLSGTTSTSNTLGVVRITGGTVRLPDYILLARGVGSQSAFTVDGGSIFHTNAANPISIGYEGGRGELNLTGGTLESFGKHLIVRQSAANPTGIVNLCSGLLSVDNMQVNSPGIALLNFAGGTLKAGNVDSDIFVPSSLTGAYIYGPFGAFAGGAGVDTAGRTVGVAEPIRKPSGNGVYAIALSDMGSGYIGEPYVEIAGPDGLGATAVADMEDDGTGKGTYRVSGVRITCPGVDYVTTPTVTFKGGGTTAVSPTVDSVTLAANASGGLTKLGAGVLKLSAANTYEGSTVISNGTLRLVNALALPTGSDVVLAGGTLDLGGFTVTNAISGLGAITNGTIETVISPAGAGAVGVETYTLSGVQLKGTYVVDVTAEGDSDLLAIQGSIDVSGLVVELVDPAQLRTTKEYTIATVSGSRTGTFTLANAPENWHLAYFGNGVVKLIYSRGTLMLLK